MLGLSTKTTSGDNRSEFRLSDWLERHLGSHWRLVQAVCCLFAVLIAWQVRFFPDDSFIGYRYARNASRGLDLVYNPGEQVEGYSNFLWTFIHILPEKLNWSAPDFSSIVGLFLIVGFFLIFWRLSRKILGSQAMAFIAVLVLITNMTFMFFAAGGMETMLQALLVVSIGCLLYPIGQSETDGDSWREILAGSLAGLAILTRIDSVVLLGVIFLVYIYQRYKLSDATVRKKIIFNSLIRISFPVLLIVAPWLVWKLSFYGHVLPNTLAAKTSDHKLISFLYGIFYVACFFLSYGLFLLAPRLRFLKKILFSHPSFSGIFLAIPAWLAYICLIGGDFMEFRFFVPILPFLALLIAVLIDRYASLKKQLVLIILLLIFSAAHYWVRNPTIYPYPVWTFRELNLWPESRLVTGWPALGKLLQKEFTGGQTVENQPVIAVMPAGAIPYFSDLPTVDMLGLNDRWITSNGVGLKSYYPGHIRVATVDYLVSKRVDLILGLPLFVTPNNNRASYRLSELAAMYFAADLRQLPEMAQVVEIPLAPDQSWVVIYLGQNGKVDAAIQKNNWRVVPIDRRCDSNDFNAWLDLVGTATCFPSY